MDNFFPCFYVNFVFNKTLNYPCRLYVLKGDNFTLIAGVPLAQDMLNPEVIYVIIIINLSYYSILLFIDICTIIVVKVKLNLNFGRKMIL
jgi:hypothetical protein